MQDRFVGHWEVDRHIHDLDSAWTGRFSGRATFSPVPGALAYREEGILRLGGLTMRARRAYRWEFPSEAEVAVYFEDGRFFHSFDPRQARAEASHYCDPDLYEVTYVFLAPDHWLAEWRVEGPRKDYRMVTHYRRPG
ncbi:MAG TPA: DUF6314 family protein [Paracoccaceae bacterium]|nr:DUF6314 family protein [Paracoccaceae bacterium]